MAECCQHCAGLVKDVSTLSEHMLVIVESVSTIKAVTERLDHELLGNGQPGRCSQHSQTLGELQRWQSYMKGAMAVIVIIGTAILSLGGVLLAHILSVKGIH